MPLSVLWWVIYVVALLFFGAGIFRADAASRWGWGGSLILWVLLGILGYAVFGSVVKG